VIIQAKPFKLSTTRRYPLPQQQWVQQQQVLLLFPHRWQAVLVTLLVPLLFPHRWQAVLVTLLVLLVLLVLLLVVVAVRTYHHEDASPCRG
jgi:phosphatidylserine synthase